MAALPISEIVQHLRRTVVVRDNSVLTDGQLLNDYLNRQDDAALATLVRRHGPMVWSVCRRILDNYHDAEDAFQATFLVFVRKAASIASPELLANWLYGVARQTALKARAIATKRKMRERPMTEMPAPAEADSAWRDLQPLLDRELSRLPAKLRVAVLLCDLGGKTRKEAAQQLGVPEGTVASRLGRARALLAKRVARHGLAALGGALTAMLSRNTAAASVPVSVVSSTIKAASLLAAGQAAASEIIPVKVAALSEGVVQSMLHRKLAVATLVLVIAALIGTGVGALMLPRLMAGHHDLPEIAGPNVERLAAARPAAGADDGKPAAEKPTERKGILVWKEGKLAIVASDGKLLAEVQGDPDKAFPKEPAISPDGKRLAFIAAERPPFDLDGNYRRHIFIRELDGKSEGFKLELTAQNIAWAPDGKLLVVEATSYKQLTDRQFTTWLVDVGTKDKRRLDLPASAQVFAIAPDGKSFLAQTYDADEQKSHLSTIDVDGKKTAHLINVLGRPIGMGGLFTAPKLSPDGSRLLFLDINLSEKLEKGMPRLPQLFVYDLKAQKRERLAEVPLNSFIMGFAWSPDSRRLAYAWKRVEPGVPLVNSLNAKGEINNPKAPTETESHLTVADANGRNPRTVMSTKGKSGPAVTMGSLDWR